MSTNSNKAFLDMSINDMLTATGDSIASGWDACIHASPASVCNGIADATSELFTSEEKKDEDTAQPVQATIIKLYPPEAEMAQMSSVQLEQLLQATESV